MHLACFLNEKRPKLQQSTVTELPVDALGPDLSSQLEASLTVDLSDNLACAASARLWECLLEDHRLPYLLLRVADTRMILGSKVTALTLYDELQTTLQDPQLGSWIGEAWSSLLVDEREQLHAYKTSQRFTPSQRWRSTAQIDGSFPYCKLQRAQLNLIRDQWKDMGPLDVVMTKFMNLHCLETNVIEGVFQFDSSATTRLVEAGFYDQAVAAGPSPVGGAVRDRAEALSILRDTHQALNEVLALAKSDTLNITVETICRLHKTLMQTSRVLYIDTPYGRRLSYLNIGITRQVSRVNVTATSQDGVKIQFCPYDEVDAELNTFCERFNKLVQQPDMDPFAAAAWISHVFVTIHPFEDGNGRLSRLLASIPLLKKGLMPLCVPAFYKLPYHRLLNSVRANRDGDYQRLMEILYNGTRASVDWLKAMV